MCLLPLRQMLSDLSSSHDSHVREVHPCSDESRVEPDPALYSALGARQKPADNRFTNSLVLIKKKIARRSHVAPRVKYRTSEPVWIPLGIRSRDNSVAALKALFVGNSCKMYSTRSKETQVNGRHSPLAQQKPTLEPRYFVPPGDQTRSAKPTGPRRRPPQRDETVRDQSTYRMGRSHWSSPPRRGQPPAYITMVHQTARHALTSARVTCTTMELST